MRDKIKLAHLQYKKDKMQERIDLMVAKIQNDELKEELEGPEEEEKKEAAHGRGGGGGDGGHHGGQDPDIDSFDDDLQGPIGADEEDALDDEVNHVSAMVGNASNVIGNATFEADLS